MYDAYDDHLERHVDFLDYQAMMSGEDGAEGSLPADCEPDFAPQVFEHNVFSDEWTEEDLSDFLENE